MWREENKLNAEFWRRKRRESANVKNSAVRIIYKREKKFIPHFKRPPHNAIEMPLSITINSSNVLKIKIYMKERLIMLKAKLGSSLKSRH
jgi:hypothetical protein